MCINSDMACSESGWVWVFKIYTDWVRFIFISCSYNNADKEYYFVFPYTWHIKDRHCIDLIMVQPSWISPNGINVTKPRLEEHNNLVPTCKMIISIHFFLFNTRNMTKMKAAWQKGLCRQTWRFIIERARMPFFSFVKGSFLILIGSTKGMIGGNRLRRFCAAL